MGWSMSDQIVVGNNKINFYVEFYFFILNYQFRLNRSVSGGVIEMSPAFLCNERI